MTHPEGWQIGMEVCVVVTLNVRGDPLPRAAKIAKIGRRWITLDDGEWHPTRFDAETRRIDGKGYASPGDVYESEEEYRETSAKEVLWKDFRGRLPYTAPDHLSVADIEKISAAIFTEYTGNGHD